MIAQFGGAGDAFALRERILDRAHHDLSLAEYSVDCEADCVRFFAKHQHVKTLAAFVIHFKHARQSKQGSFQVSFDLAYMISRFVQNTESIRDSLEDLEKGKPVTLEGSVYEAAVDAIQGNRFTREQCR